MSQPSIACAETVFIPTRTDSTVPAQNSSNCSHRQSSRWIKQLVGGVALTGLTLSLLSSGKAEAISITRIADTNTFIPGSTDTFDFFEVPSLDNGQVAFRGTIGYPDTGTEQEGVYTTTGDGLNIVADTNTPIPGGTGTFERFSRPSLDNGNVAFVGSRFDFQTDFLQRAIYTTTGDGLNVVADMNTPIPDGTGVFEFLETFSLDNGQVAFSGGGFTQQGLEFGIYTQNIGGELNVVADRNTLIPSGTGTFQFLGSVSLDNGQVAFGGGRNGGDIQEGIYTTTSDGLNVVANQNTLVPGRTLSFDSFGPPSLDNGNVAFRGDLGFLGGPEGIYTSINGELNVVEDNLGRPDDFFPSIFSFSDPSLDNGNVAFVGTNLGDRPSIYTTIGGQLVAVINSNTPLEENKFITSLSLGSEGLSENQIAFRATFDDGSQGIYVATIVPEPSSVLSILAVGAFGASWILKRR